MGHLDQGKRARFYELTAAGRKALRSQAAGWQSYVDAVAGVLNATPATPEP